MNLDLSRRNISELRLDDKAGGDLDVHGATAQYVGVVDASHNQITRVVGLGAVFMRLVELKLSHNALGITVTPPCVTQQHARHAQRQAAREGWAAQAQHVCGGLPDWITALPPTLEVLDLSYNHLSSLVTCTCGQQMAADAGDPPALRALRHACPLTLAAVLPASRLPRLRQLNLAHNALVCSLAESDEMEEAWRALSVYLPPGMTCAATEVDLSFNPGLAAANSVLLCATTPGAGDTTSHGDGGGGSRLVSLSLRECGLDDLVGLAGAAVYAPRLSRLELHSTPLSASIVNAPPLVLADFMQSLLLSTLGRSEDDTSLEARAVAKALAHLTEVGQLPQLDMGLRAATGSSAGGPALAAIARFVYAALLLEVVPSLRELDGDTDVHHWRNAGTAAMQQALLVQSAGAARLRTPATTQFVRRRSLSNLAAAVAPQLHPRVVVQRATKPEEEEEREGEEAPGNEDSATHVRTSRFQAALEALPPLTTAAPPPATIAPAFTGDSSEEAVPSETAGYTPAGLLRDPAALARYEALSAEARRLEETLLEINARHDEAVKAVVALTSQLTADRRLITDQHREAARLRGRRDALLARTQAQRARLQKRQREIAYGVDAMRSRVSAALAKERAREQEGCEQAIARREKRQQQRRLAQLVNLSVNYGHPIKPAVAARPVRSVILREAAIRKKIMSLESKEPLAYSPARFPRSGSSASRPLPRDGRFNADGDARFASNAEPAASRPRSRGDEGPAEVRAAAEAYCRSLSPEQRRQLQTALVTSRATSPRSTRGADSSSGGSSSRGRRSPGPRSDGPVLRPPPPLPSPPPMLSPLSPSARDLSALSLTELFEAAASLRQRQLALQQLQDQWQEQKRSASAAARVRGRATSPLADVSPATPQPPAAETATSTVERAAAVHEPVAVADSLSQAPSSVSSADEGEEVEEEPTHSLDGSGGAAGDSIEEGTSARGPRVAAAGTSPPSPVHAGGADAAKDPLCFSPSEGPAISRALFS